MKHQESKLDTKRDDSTENHSKYHMWPSILTAVMTAILTASTTFVAISWQASYQAAEWRGDKMYQIEKDIFDKRISLLERFAEISRKDTLLQTLAINNKLTLLELQHYAIKKNADASTRIIREYLGPIEKFNTYRAEYLTVLTLSEATFGPKTRTEIGKLLKTHNPDVWNASEQQIDNITRAMSGELVYGLGEIPVNTRSP